MSEDNSKSQSPDMDLHLRAEKRFVNNQETDLDGLHNSKYKTKRVRVDRFSKEFSEARDRGGTADFLCGDVRRYILNMNQQKNDILINNINFHVKGNKTGSNFYPHGGLATGSQSTTKYCAVTTARGTGRHKSIEFEQAQ